MFTGQRLIISIIIVSICVSPAFCADPDVSEKVTCSGKVVDDANKAVAGVNVKMILLKPDSSFREIADVNTEQQITKDDGSFSFNEDKLTDGTYRMAMLVAQKDGYAISWDNWDIRKDKTSILTLEKPYKLQGIVVDDANKPVKDVEVCISMLVAGDIRNGNSGRYLTVGDKLDLFKTTTDANGIFVFKDIPVSAKAEFMAKKAGYATISTFKFDPSNYNPGQYTIESKDIKVILPVESKIEGKVVESGSEKPLGGIKIMCLAEPRVAQSAVKPVASKDDGTFTFDGLEAKTYMLQASSSRKETATWVIEPVTVTTIAGKTSSDIVMKASKGGMVEIVVQDSEKKNIAGVNVFLSSKDRRQGQPGITDSNGVATIRLLPGDYELQGAQKNVITHVAHFKKSNIRSFYR